MFTQMGTSGNLPFCFFIPIYSLYQYHPYIHQSIPSIPDLTPYPIRRWYCHAVVPPSFLLRYLLTFIKKTSLAGVEPAIFRFVVWRVSIAPQALPIYIFPPSFSLLFDCYHDYPFLTLSLVGSYQVGYTRSHPNTEVKMLRACSVPLCSHRWERQVIYLLFFLL